MALLERTEAAGEKLLVHPLVLAELGWVLSAAYGYDRTKILDVMEELVDAPPLVVSQRTEVKVALEWYKKGPADLADYLILALVRAEQADKLVTFDRHLLKHELCEKP